MNQSHLLGRDILGAFADGAVLFPLLALLSMHAGFSSITVLLTTGTVYIIAAAICRIPMSVQPLNSIVIAAVAAGAKLAEIKLSGLLLGITCLGLCLLNVDQISKRVPAAVIHQLQFGLGILLIFQGLKAGGNFAGLLTPVGILALGGAVFMVASPNIAWLPLLGLVATAGLFIAVFFSSKIDTPAAITATTTSIRFGMIASLLLPQLALTLTNSVLATRDVAHRYFNEKASHVTIRNLLGSIGLGNVLISLVGGMPFCHGSGGITAHIRGGSSRAWSTALMGFVLIGLAAVQALNGTRVLVYPPQLVMSLLVATGVFHLQLVIHHK